MADKRLQWADPTTLERIKGRPCVYKITSPSGKVYVGSTIDLARRIKYYKSLDCNRQRKLYNSFKKYGTENHNLEILEFVSLVSMYERERYWGLKLDVLKKGLNCALPNAGTLKALISEETRVLMSRAKVGCKNKFFGRKHSTATKLRIAKAQIGRVHTLEHRNKVSQNNARYKAKLVLDLSTGVFFNSAREAALAFSLKHSTVRSQLNGTNRNKTNLIYA